MHHAQVDRRSFVQGAAAMGIAAAAAGTVVGATVKQARAAEGAAYADGTYTGTAAGMGGDINVTLVIKDGVIAVEDISPNNETKGIGGYEAIEDGTYAAQIEAAQGPEIDGIAGATITSDAIKLAVQRALERGASR